MTRRLFAALALVLLLPAVSFALGMCERGNKPQSPLNYPTWPGIIDVVNDVSRESLCWVNGDERFSYRGDTAALNRVLKEFSEVEAEELHVVLRPGPGRLALIGRKATEASIDASGDYADWELHVIQGIVRGHVLHEQLEAIYDMHPTLTVYVTERTDLKALKIPERIKVVQHADLRERYEDAYAFGDDRVRARVQRVIEEFDAETPKEGTAAEEFQSRLTAIQEFVRRRQAAKIDEIIDRAFRPSDSTTSP
jgi:hypothetical protein